MNNMKKIIVIGCPGSGKSTFSKRLNKISGIPLYHLDNIWYRKDKTTLTEAEFKEAQSKIINAECWIMDGNYGKTLEMRVKACDTIYLFDIPNIECVNSIEQRIGKKRTDIPWIEYEFDKEFKAFVLNFPQKELLHIYNILKTCNKKNIHIFFSRNEANEYLNELELRD